MAVASGANDLDSRLGDPAELLQLRLEGLPALMAIQYVVSFVLMFLPIATNTESAGWAGIWLALSTLATAYVYQTRRRLAGLMLVGSLLAVWALSLWLFPPAIAVWFALLVIGEAGTLFGARATFIACLAVTGCILAAADAGRLSTEVAASASVLTWLDAGFFWLAARPAILSLEWVWTSFDDARESRDQLRLRQGELNKALKTLDLAYQRLESMNAELNHARQVAEEARRLKSEFAASISHELRTPLNLIIGFAEMMLMGPRSRLVGGLPDTFRGDIEAIYRNACHLSSLIDDILDLSQIDAHRMGLRKQPAALGPITQEAMTAISTMFRDKGLSLEAQIPEDLPVVSVDRVRVRQVLINLLNNAARFTSEGGVTIRATWSERDVVVSVCDTGVGILPEELPTVFDEFRQVGPQGSRHHSGLGLTICKRFVELHGGNVWADSTPGGGSAFHFSLPRVESVVSSPPEPDWDTVTRTIARDAKPPRVGILDDDPTVLKVFERYLDGYQVVKSARGRRARQPSKGDGVCAVVVTRAADLEGGSTVPRLETGGVPVISCPLRTIRDTTTGLGVTQYLHKPVSRDQIRASLVRLGRPIREVLVVDDEPDMVRMLGRMVRAEFRRCRVLEAQSGLQALELLGEHQPDAVLLDLLMPDLDGYGVIDRIREDERLREVPVIVITARGAEDESIVVRSLGINRSGGFTIGEAMGCLKSCLDQLQGPAVGSAAQARSEDRRE